MQIGIFIDYIISNSKSLNNGSISRMFQSALSINFFVSTLLTSEKFSKWGGNFFLKMHNSSVFSLTLKFFVTIKPVSLLTGTVDFGGGSFLSQSITKICILKSC